jgi:hypothetical protein
MYIIIDTLEMPLIYFYFLSVGSETMEIFHYNRTNKSRTFSGINPRGPWTLPMKTFAFLSSQDLISCNLGMSFTSHAGTKLGSLFFSSWSMRYSNTI